MSVEPFSSLAQAIVGVGLLAFAAVQVWLQFRESRDRRQTAYAALYAQYWRLNALETDWTGQNLVAAARAGTLYPDMLAPRDWGTMVRLKVSSLLRIPTRPTSRRWRISGEEKPNGP